MARDRNQRGDRTTPPTREAREPPRLVAPPLPRPPRVEAPTEPSRSTVDLDSVDSVLHAAPATPPPSPLPRGPSQRGREAPSFEGLDAMFANLLEDPPQPTPRRAPPPPPPASNPEAAALASGAAIQTPRGGVLVGTPVTPPRGHRASGGHEAGFDRSLTPTAPAAWTPRTVMRAPWRRRFAVVVGAETRRWWFIMAGLSSIAGILLGLVMSGDPAPAAAGPRAETSLTAIVVPEPALAAPPKRDVWVLPVAAVEGSAPETLVAEDLERMVAELSRCRSRILVEGHTCTLGTESANLELGLRRAESVRKLLIQHGVESSRIAVSSRGSGDPLQSNETPEGRRANRRVTVECLDGR